MSADDSTTTAATERLCHKSFAEHPEDHTDPGEHDGWGVCRGCGEVVNTRGRYVPEHRRPTHDE